MSDAETVVTAITQSEWRTEALARECRGLLDNGSPSLNKATPLLHRLLHI